MRKVCVCVCVCVSSSFLGNGLTDNKILPGMIVLITQIIQHNIRMIFIHSYLETQVYEQHTHTNSKYTEILCTQISTPYNDMILMH